MAANRVQPPRCAVGLAWLVKRNKRAVARFPADGGAVNANHPAARFAIGAAGSEPAWANSGRAFALNAGIIIRRLGPAAVTRGGRRC